jgi:ubiquinone/menaquinone biosynthesis C-methylase UbiE
MTSEESYKKFAKYYDKIYADKDYSAEVEFIKWAVKKYKTGKGTRLLDVACGTGNHLVYLKNDFSVMGIDLNSKMLEIAKEKMPEVMFKKCDMKKLNLEERFDVILCMFATIAYNLTYEELEHTLKIFYEHLSSGGVIIFDLHIHEDYWLGDRVWINTVVEKDLQLARISPSPQKKEILDLNMIFLIKEKGKVDFDIDQHQIALFNVEKIKKVMSKIGFQTKIYAGITKKLWNKKMESPAVFVGVK